MAMIILENGNDALRDYPLYRGGIKIGRGEENTIVLTQPEVSGYHARIDRREAEYILTDLQSTNGTLVNGRKVFSHRLSHGDKISIGKNTLLFISTEKANNGRQAPKIPLDRTVIVGGSSKRQKTTRTQVATFREYNIPKVKTSNNTGLFLIATCAVAAILVTIGVPTLKDGMLSLKGALMSSEQKLRHAEKRERSSEHDSYNYSGITSSMLNKSDGEYLSQKDIGASMPPVTDDHNVQNNDDYYSDIEAIAWSSDSSKSFVVARGEEFRIGESFEVATITDIGRDYVVLQSTRGKSIFRLSLH